MCPSNHRNVLIWFFFIPELSPFVQRLCDQRKYNHWVNRYHITSSFHLTCLLLFTVKQKDNQNRDKRKRGVLEVHQRPVFVVHTLWKSHIQSIKFKFIPCFRVANALGSGERDLALQQGIMASSNGKYGLTNYFHSVREDTSQPVELTTCRRGITDWMSSWIVNPFLWVKRNWFLPTLSRGHCHQLVKTVIRPRSKANTAFKLNEKCHLKYIASQCLTLLTLFAAESIFATCSYTLVARASIQDFKHMLSSLQLSVKVLWVMLQGRQLRGHFHTC